MLHGTGLGPLSFVLRARQDAVDAWQAMQTDVAYAGTRAVADLDVGSFAAVIFPGGHAPGMRAFLEDKGIQGFARKAFAADKVVGAICHGVVVLARAGVLRGRKTTSLLKKQERLAYQLTRLWLGRYYLTYETTVQDDAACVTRGPSCGASPSTPEEECVSLPPEGER